jgi:hypothetical protein
MVMAAGYLAYVVVQGGTTVAGNYFRLYVPVLPPLAILASLGCAEIRRQSGVNVWVRRAVAAGMVFLFACRLGDSTRTMWASRSSGISLGAVWGTEPALAESRVRLEAGHVRVGRWLHEHADPDARVVVWDAGAIPYYSDLTTLDSWSLNDIDIAIMKRDGVPASTVADFILMQAPDYYVTPTYSVTASQTFQQNYRLRKDASSDGYYYALEVFERRYPVLLDHAAIDRDGELRPAPGGLGSKSHQVFMPLDPGFRGTYQEALDLVQGRSLEYIGRGLTDTEIDDLKRQYGDAGPQAIYTGTMLNPVLQDIFYRGRIAAEAGVGYAYSPIGRFETCAEPFDARRIRPGADTRVTIEMRVGSTPWVRTGRWSDWQPSADLLRAPHSPRDRWRQCRMTLVTEDRSLKR